MGCFEKAKKIKKKLIISDPDMYLKELEERFNQINFNEYSLSYSGGRDSHFLYWFIKTILKDDKIKIVACNTLKEHSEILQRMYRYADVVVYPKIKTKEFKEKYGLPCFTKLQDEYIERYQKGLRSENCLNVIYGKNITMNLNKKARELLLSGKLHKISNKCCKIFKKDPLIKWNKENNKKSIIGVTQEESKIRKQAYGGLFTKKEDFTPIFDLTNELLKKIESIHNIEIPKIYDYVDRTGCMGCPYAPKKNTEKELTLISESQRKATIDFFKESYEVKGII